MDWDAVLCRWLWLFLDREWRLWALPRVVVGRVAVDNQFFRFVLLDASLY